MLLSLPKYLCTSITFFVLVILFLTRRHAAQISLSQKRMDDAFETSEQTVIGGGMTELQDTTVYDKLSAQTPSDIEANWSATISAKSLLQKVREFRESTQASYNDDSKKGVRRQLEDAEFELEKLGKESFDTKKIVQGVQKLKVALKAAEKVIARGPERKTMTSSPADGDTAATQLGESFQEAEKDRKTKQTAALREKLQKAELDPAHKESRESPHFH